MHFNVCTFCLKNAVLAANDRSLALVTWPRILKCNKSQFVFRTGSCQFLWSVASSPSNENSLHRCNCFSGNYCMYRWVHVALWCTWLTPEIVTVFTRPVPIGVLLFTWHELLKGVSCAQHRFYPMSDEVSSLPLKKSRRLCSHDAHAI